MDSDNAWHCLEGAQALTRLASSADGISSEEAARRLLEQGPNLIPEGRRRSVLSMLVGQFADVMILILLVAALVSGFIGEPQDTIAILVIVLLNATIGTVQELRSERAVAALRKMAAPEAFVLRDGGLCRLPASGLVAGDIVLLDAGNLVPADLRLLEIEELQVDESMLTGESHPVSKGLSPLAQGSAPLGDRHNLAFKSSLVTRGRGRGVVVATGANTEIGRIAALLQGESGVRTPLQVRIARFGRYLALAVLAICAVLFVAGLLQGQPPVLMFLTAVSLAVAAIPEALPAVVTISLALGARKLILQRALVRNLPAVETLGSVTFICSDKTGTLTENRMSAECFVVGGQRHAQLPQEQTVAARWLGWGLALNNDVASIDGKPAGDPTELALYEAAVQGGYDRQVLEQDMPRVEVLAFDSDRKLMTTLHRQGEQFLALTKGAPEAVLGLCSRVVDMPADQAVDTAAWLQCAQELAGEGYRVLAVAAREVAAQPGPQQLGTLETDMTLVGLVALIDPPRPEAAGAVAECQLAGITPVMITGDHPGTARAIAQRLGIVDGSSALITGPELDDLSDADFAGRVRSIRVYARVSPAQKLRIVKALQDAGEFVAMTGDGVNDAPALKRADIGVSMGLKGTDVAREAADMVLLDDNFATIVRAVRAGRRIFDNIRKFIKDTMSSNSGEIWTLFLAPFMGLPIPLLPIHILWINLVTDGLPGLAFAAEPAEEGIMKRPPRPPRETIFAHGMWQHIIWMGLFVGGISITAQAWAISRGVEYWQTVVFTVLTLSQLFHSLAVRSETASLLRIGLFSNLPMLGAVAVTVLLQMAVIYLPALNGVFHTQPLPLYDLSLCFALSSLVLVAVEIEKWLVRRGLIYSPSQTQ